MNFYKDDEKKQIWRVDTLGSKDEQIEIFKKEQPVLAELK